MSKNLLGQGLGSLLGAVEDEKTISGGVTEVSVDNISPCSHQPRTFFDEAKLIELSESIKENGIIQPLVVIKLANGKYELIAGERRLRASKLAGLETVPVIIKEDTDTKERSFLSLIENIQRSDLNCIEVAKGYKRIIDEFKLTHDELAKKIAVNRSSISNSIRILTLPDSIVENIEIGRISFGHAKLLVSIKDADILEQLAEKIIKSEISVAKLSNIIKDILSGNTEEKEAKPAKEKVEVEPTPFLEIINTIPYNVEVKKLSKSEGKIMIDYRSIEDLEKILRLLKE